MLNISNNSIKGRVDEPSFGSFKMLREFKAGKIITRLMVAGIFVVGIISFLPWTQNIRTNGNVTALNPEERPQSIHSVIAGRIDKWFVREGDTVHKGDTILYITEIKDEYFDPQLLDRTEMQIKAKEATVLSYMEKVKSMDKQIDALIKTKNLKLEQAENYLKQAHLKVKTDSIDLVAAQTNISIAEDQFTRYQQLYENGLKSKTELEGRKLKLQEAQAKVISAENKLLGSKNEVLNARVELTSIENQYQDKLAKAEAEKYAAMSSLYDSEATVTKMQNQYMNYSVRAGMYYITAPQDGYITKTIKTGLGETIKEGEELLTIMPANYQLAVEIFVDPVDLPLVQFGQPIRFMFDGWPSVVFSGWPNASFGTFGGEVVAIDNNISKNGKYRILVKPDPNDQPWPNALRVGSGAIGMALLKDVPIWYEVWRQLNGFPPDFYVHDQEKQAETTKSAKKK